MFRKSYSSALILAALATAGIAQAQSYPVKPINIIVPAGTGGPDTVARLVAAQLTQQMGQSVIVSNRPGANGLLGSDAVAKAPPDGYTLMVYSSGLVVNKYLVKKMPYDTEKDFTPITNLVISGGLFITVNPALPVKTLAELIALGRKPDNKLSYSTPGVGNTWHIATELMNERSGMKMVHIPYKGGGPATAALMAGEVQVLLSSPAPVLQHIKSGKVRALAYTAPTRSASLPDVPTTAEAGLPSFQIDGGWFGMFGPGAMPGAIVDRLFRETRAAMNEPQTLARIKALGVDPVGDTPAEFRRFYDNEIRKYGEYVKIARIEPE